MRRQLVGRFDGKKYQIGSNGSLTSVDTEDNDQKLERDYSDVLKLGEIKAAIENQPGQVFDTASRASDFLENQHAKLEEEYKKTESYRKTLMGGMIAGSAICFISGFAWIYCIRCINGKAGLKYALGAIALAGAVACAACFLIRQGDSDLKDLIEAKEKSSSAKIQSYKNNIDRVGTGVTGYTNAYKLGGAFASKNLEMNQQLYLEKIAEYFNKQHRNISDAEMMKINSRRKEDLFNTKTVNDIGSLKF